MNPNEYFNTMIMKTLTVFFFVIIVVVLTACNKPTATNYADFMTAKNIQLDEHTVSVLLGMPMDMLIISDFLIILDGQPDRFFHVLSKDRPSPKQKKGVN